MFTYVAFNIVSQRTKFSSKLDWKNILQPLCGSLEDHQCVLNHMTVKCLWDVGGKNRGSSLQKGASHTHIRLD